MDKKMVAWFDIPVTNLERAKQFYSHLLEMELGEPVSSPDNQFCMIAEEGCIYLATDRKPSREGPLLYFSVEGRMETVLEKMREWGEEIVMPRHPIGEYGFRSIILDTEGNSIALHSMQ